MTRDDIERSIAYQLMAQPQAQDVTVTFADGTSFTARYVGSGVRRVHTGATGGEPYSYLQLFMIAPLGADVDSL